MSNKNRHQIDVYVGQKLRERRQELGLSQEKLGEAVHLTFQQIQKYEKGYNRISCSKLYEFSNILEINIEYFFPDSDLNVTEYIFKPSPIELHPLDSGNNIYNAIEEASKGYELENEVIEMIKYFKSISSKEAREHILNLTKLLAENKEAERIDLSSSDRTK